MTETLGDVLAAAHVGTDQPAIWANDAAQDTQQEITFARPASLPTKACIVVHNPSTVTDLAVKVFSVETDLAGATRYGLIASYTVPKAATVTGTDIDTHAKQVYGAFNGTDFKLVLSNNTLLGAADGFTATIRMRELA